MRSRCLYLLLLAWFSWPAPAQRRPDALNSLRIELPPDSPVVLLAADLGDSATTTRGSATIIDLRASLSLRNSGLKPIRAVTFLVTAQELTPGGKASVTVPSLSAAPGEIFPVRINLRLLRPVSPLPPVITVSLDGLLFDDLSFFGPNRLGCRRTMTVWELEARRDRQHFRSILASEGEEGLRRALLSSLARQAERPQLAVQVLRRGRATALPSEQPIQFAFLAFPDCPVEPLAGTALVTANEASSPAVEVRNRSRRTVRYFELAWVVRDAEGREFIVGSLSSHPGLNLAPGERARIHQDTVIRFSNPSGKPVQLAGMGGFVTQVEFADNTIWIPSRQNLSHQSIRQLLPPSAEEERLADLYRRKGLAAVIEELRRLD